MKRDEDGFINFSNLDPDVRGAIDQGRQRQAARRTPAQLRKAEEAKAKKAAKDRQRNRRMIDLPADLEEILEKKAAELSVPFSSLVIFLVDRALTDIDWNEVREQREPSRSMRYEYIFRHRGKDTNSRGRLR